jgi:hypothetical protein
VEVKQKNSLWWDEDQRGWYWTNSKQATELKIERIGSGKDVYIHTELSKAQKI